jgi:ATP-dependent DNA helicase RecQ
LRSYGGIFDQLTGIKESDLAKRLAINRAEVISILHKLPAMELIHYVEQSDKPHLLCVKPRVDSSHLLINKKYHTDRYEIHKTQIESIIKYAVNPTCRSQQLLHYFNEPNAPLCGVCDICLAAKSSSMNHNINEILPELILNILIGKKLSLSDLIKLINIGTETEKLDAIRLLLDAGNIHLIGDQYTL